jgi:hypothetical protein
MVVAFITVKLSYRSRFGKDRLMPRKGSKICPNRGWRLGGVGTFGVVACVQEVAITPGELLADADLIHYTLGASEKDEEEAIRKAVDFSRTARRQTVDWSGFWDWLPLGRPVP